MRVIVTISADGANETRIEGNSPFLGGDQGDSLEEKGLGFWLTDHRFVESQRKPLRKGRVFIPWSSVLYIEERRL